MNGQHLERLTTHLSNLSVSLIKSVDHEGMVRSSQPGGGANFDLAATYHVADLLLNIDIPFFKPILDSVYRLITDDDKLAIDNPHAMDLFSQLAPRSQNTEKLLKKNIVLEQYEEGYWDMYVGYLNGGDYFTTLWCTKILLNYSRDIFIEPISRALDYLINKKSVAAKVISHLGFLGALLMQTDPGKYKKEIDDIFSDIKAKMSTLEYNPKHPIPPAPLFTCNNLLDYYLLTNDSEALTIAESFLSDVFDLEHEAKAIPPMLAVEGSANMSQVHLMILARACISAKTLCKINGNNSLDTEIYDVVSHDWLQQTYLARLSTAELMKYRELYGSLHNHFEHYDPILQQIWENQAPREKTVFLMMPFTDNNNFQTLTQAIKKSGQKYGFTVFRADDEERQYLQDTLWDNLVINMLSAKYAIAIYANDPSVHIQSGDSFFPNPNVALEYGFFKSRGQDVLVLRDINSPLPTNIEGFLWAQFDLQNPGSTVKQPVEQWFRQIAQNDNQS